MMMGEDSLDSSDQRDAYRLAVETAVQDDNRTAMGQVKSIRRMPVARSVGQASKLTELMEPFRKFLSPKVKFMWDDRFFFL